MAKKKIKNIKLAGRNNPIETKRKLEEEASRMVTVVRDSNDAILILDLKGNILAWNRGAVKMFGYSEKEALGMKISQLVPSNKLAEQKDFHRRIFAGAKISSFDTQRLTKDGRLLDIWLTVTKLVDDAGKIIGIATTERDITERKNAEEKLRASEEKYRALSDTATDLVFMVDRNHRYLSVNQSVATICHMPVHKIIGRRVSDFFPKKTSLNFIRNLDFVFNTGLPKVNFEESMEVGKQVRTISTSLNPVKDTQGKVIAVAGIVRDITAQRALALNLAEAEAQYRSLFMNMNSGFAFCQMIYRNGKPDNFVYLEVNKQFSILTGLKNVVGKKVTDVLPGIKQSNPELFEVYGRVAKTQKPEQFETHSDAFGGWLSISVYSPMKGYFAAVFDNITARKRTEEAVRRNETELRRAQRIGRIGNFDWDARTDTIVWSDEYYRIYGFKLGQKPPGYKAHLRAYTIDSAARLDAAVKHTMKTGEPYVVDLEHISPDGTRKWITARGEVKRDDNRKIIGLRGTAQDITQRKTIEIILHRLNLQLLAISECNEALIRSEDEETLLNDICRIVCEKAGYRMAWVGFAMNDREKNVSVMAHAGAASDYLRHIKITWGTEPTGRGPTGTAIRMGKPIINQDFETDPKARPWRKEARKYGYRSSIALPLFGENGKPFGALNIYSAEINAFTPDGVRLLRELSNDLAFGILSLRNRAERKKTEEALQQSEARYRLIANNTSDVIWTGQVVLRPGLPSLSKAKKLKPKTLQKLLQFHFTYVSPSVKKTRGWTSEEFVQKKLWDTLTPKSYHLALQTLIDELILESSPGSDPNRTRMLPLEALRKDGSTFWIETNMRFLRNEKGEPVGIMGINRDITDRKEAEDELRESRHFLDSIINAIDDPIFVKDEEHRWIDMNSKFCDFVGHSREELLFKSDYDFFPKKQADVFYQKDDQVFKSNKPLVNEEELTSADGKIHTLVTTKTVFSDRVSKRKFLVGVIHDITDQKKVQLALAESEAQYRDIVENSPEMIHSIDSRGIIFFVNRKECELLGYKREELIGQPMDKIYSPLLVKEVKQGFDQLKKRGSLNIPHTQFIAKNGSLIDVEMHSIALYDTHEQVHGHFVRTRSISLDISERTRAEAALKLSEEKYRDIVENSPEMIHSVDASGKITFVNKRECELLGYRTNELVGKPMSKIYSPHLLKKIEAGFDKLKKEGSLTVSESQMIKKNGEPLDVEVHSIALYDKVGKHRHQFTQTRSIIVDITEQKKARLELLKYKLGIERSSQAIFITDREGFITYINPAFTKMYGYSESEALGHTPRILKSGINPLSFYRNLWKLLLSGNSFHSEITNKTKDGRLIQVVAAANPILNEKNEIVGFLAIQTDITQQKKNEFALLESENRYRTLVESLPACIKLFDAKGKLVSINHHGKEEHGLMGMSDEEIRRWNYLESIEKEDHGKVKHAMEKALKGETNSFVIHHTHTHAKGGYCFSTLVPILHEGKVVNFLYSSTDITAQKTNEEELQKKVGQMEFMGRVNIKRYKKMLQLEREIGELKKRLGESPSPGSQEPNHDE